MPRLSASMPRLLSSLEERAQQKEAADLYRLRSEVVPGRNPREQRSPKGLRRSACCLLERHGSPVLLVGWVATALRHLCRRAFLS